MNSLRQNRRVRDDLSDVGDAAIQARVPRLRSCKERGDSARDDRLRCAYITVKDECSGKPNAGCAIVRGLAFVKGVARENGGTPSAGWTYTTNRGARSR